MSLEPVESVNLSQAGSTQKGGSVWVQHADTKMERVAVSFDSFVIFTRTPTGDSAEWRMARSKNASNAALKHLLSILHDHLAGEGVVPERTWGEKFAKVDGAPKPAANKPVEGTRTLRLSSLPVATKPATKAAENKPADNNEVPL